MNKHNIIISMFMTVAFTILTACQKGTENTTIKTDVQQFEAVWNELNDTYVFWSVDTTDWDAIYTKYYPIFEEMENERDVIWENTWTELTSTLLDHHLDIVLTRPSTKDPLWLNPGFYEVERRYYKHVGNPHHENFLNKLVECGRLVDTGTYSFEYNIIGDVFETRYFYSGILVQNEQNIAYLQIPSFEVLPVEMTKAINHFKRLVANENIKAAIIDVRDNRGGASENLVPLLSCFTTEPVLIGYTQTKIGLGKYDLSPKMPIIITSSSGQKREMPIIVLADINSKSTAEMVPIVLSHLPNCCVVGERTYGALGVLVGAEGITKKEDEGYTIKSIANMLFENVNGTIYEGYGVEPDIECLFDKDQWNNGIDNQLEMAISVALNKIAENRN